MIRQADRQALRSEPLEARRHGLHGLLAGFRSNESGNIAVMFGLTSILSFGALGGALDVAFATRVKSMVQNGLDAAVLGAAREKQTGASDGTAVSLADAHASSVLAHLQLSGTTSFNVVENGTAVEASATVTVPTRFLAVMGFQSIPVRASSKASFGIGSNSGTSVEVSMMLDTTGSMNGQKIADLRAAAQDLIDIVVADDQSGASSRVGLVPFSSTVKLDNQAFRQATGKDNGGGGSYKRCVVERTGAEAYTDAAPGAGAYVTPLEDRASGKPCDGAHEVFPLSSKKSDLKRMVNAIDAGGTTAGHLGTAWAWYLLSPNWAGLFGADNRPGAYGDLSARNAKGDPLLRKIAVLMTDGEYNTAYSGIDSTTQARAICAQMKNAGIVVYTVGFDLGGNATAIDTLKGCASEPGNFYETTTGAELRSAFRGIALKISPIKLVR